MSDDELRDQSDRARQEPQASIHADRLKPGQEIPDDVDEEKELWRGCYSGKAMAGTWILVALVSLGLLVLSVLFMAVPWLLPVSLGAIVLLWMFFGVVCMYRRMSVQYELTTQRFMHREGILSRRTERIEVIDMDDITCTQGFVQRMMGVGTIKIESSDRTHPELYLKGIDNVNDVADLIDDIRRKERRRRGLHIESI